MIVNNRDIYLDVAKGLAIILVVIGHVFQTERVDFDNFFPFRFIYSFHMPMFIFVSGMVASLKINDFFPVLSSSIIFSNAKKEIWGATKRLFIPFISWTVVYYFVAHNDGTLNYFKKVIDSPDNSLWFLLALFYCRILFELIRVFFLFIKKMLNIRERCSAIFESPVISFLAILMIFIIIRKCMPDVFGLGYLKHFFPYYLFGIFFYKYKDKIRYMNIMHFVCLIIFLSLVSFWFRTEVGPVEEWLSQFISPSKAKICFRMTVALCGTMSFLLFIKLVMRISLSWVHTIFAFVGSMSLGIYALHQSLMWLPPVFWGTFVVSLFMSWLIGKTPIIRFFLLGGKFFR